MDLLSGSTDAFAPGGKEKRDICLFQTQESLYLSVISRGRVDSHPTGFPSLLLFVFKKFPHFQILPFRLSIIFFGCLFKKTYILKIMVEIQYYFIIVSGVQYNY